MPLFLQRSWVEINLDNLLHNLKEVRGLLSADTELMAVVKADAYGHGAGIISLMLERGGADSFGVSNINEARALRKSGVRKPILILGFTPADLAPQISSLGATQTVMSLPYGQALSSAAQRAGISVDVHLKADTGMNRIGFPAKDGDTERQMADVAALPGLEVSGIFTHYAAADEQTPFGRAYTEDQHASFAALISRLSQRGIGFSSVHCCNSAGILFYPESHHTMVRAGILLYGLYPTGYPVEQIPLRPVMALKSAVSQVKDIAAGESVSYGCRYTADRPRTIATVPLGYADGYPRRLSNKAKAWVREAMAPVVGSVCMDQLMIDVTGLGVQQDDVVTFFGGDSPIGLENLAGLSGTIHYELCCGISRRVPRVYLKDGEVLDAIDYTL